MCQSSAINRHLLRTQTSFRCKASLEISPETRLSYLLSGSSHFGSCLEMAWEQISLAVPVFLHFLGVKPQSTETNLWKEKKKSKLQVLFNAKMSFVWYFTHHFIFLRVYAWVHSWSLYLSNWDCDVQAGALALGFSRKKWLQLPSSEVGLSQEALSCSAEEAALPGQTHCMCCWLTGRGSWRPGYETEGLEFFPAPVCLWLCYGN